MLAVKSIKNLQSYTPVDIVALEASIDRMVFDSYEKMNIREDLIDLEQVINGLGSDQFLKIYTDTLTDMLKDIPSDYFCGADMFNPAASPNIRITSLRRDHLAEDFDSAVSVIRGMVKLVAPEGSKEIQRILNLKTNTGFIKALGNLDSKYFGDLPDSFGVLQEHIRGFYSRYTELKGKKGKITSDDIKGINTNLQNITGQIFWEQISLIAREKALEIFFSQIDDPAIQAFIQSGGRVIARGKQVGTKTNSTGNQEVADSLVTISFEDKEGSVVATVTTADSTKLSGSALEKNKFFIGATKTQSETFTLGYLLDKIERKTYWENRLKVYLDGSQETSNDDANWDNTRLGFYLLAMYDVLAVRATQSGQYAQTLTVNNKINTINQVIRNISHYYQYESQGNSGIRSAENNIFTMAQTYSEYVRKQQKISRGRDWNKNPYHADEPDLESNYDNYIAQLMATKISISSNVLFYS